MSEIQPNGAAMLHTMQRHKRHIKRLQFGIQQNKKQFLARKNREELLGGTRERDYKGMSGLNRRNMYMKENQHIHNSDRLINDQISSAMETKDHLVYQ